MGNRAQKSAAWLFVAAGVLFGLAGCEDSAKTPVQVRPPQIALPSQDQVPPPLPINAQHKVADAACRSGPRTAPSSLRRRARPRSTRASRIFKAGHLGKAREEFDEALDQLLASGLDLDADPRLSSFVSPHYRHREPGRTRSLPRRRRFQRTEIHARAHR